MRVPSFTRGANLALIPRTPDLRLQTFQINLVFFFILGFWSRVNLEHGFPIYCLEIILGHRVDFEDREFAAALHRIVADASPRGDGEIPDCRTLPLQRLVVPAILTDHSDKVGYYVPGVNALLELTSKIDLD